jgi:hypothetical protein
MNPLDEQLNRLLRSAARAPHDAAVVELPARAEYRILAAWRSSRLESEGWLGPWLRSGLAAAALITAVALGLSWSSWRPPTGDEYAVANAAFYVAVAP